MSYIVYKGPYEVPRVTTTEFADQINQEQIIKTVSDISDAQDAVYDWYQDVGDSLWRMPIKSFKAHMGLSS